MAQPEFAAGAGVRLLRVMQAARRNAPQIAAAMLLLAVSLVWVYIGVRSALGELAERTLRSLLATQVAALETWIGEKQLNVQRWAADPRVAAVAAALREVEARDPLAVEAACRGAPGPGLVAAIDLLRLTEDASSVYVISPSGRVLAARDRERCGALLPAQARAQYAVVFNGATKFTVTATDPAHLGDDGGDTVPKVWIAAPVRAAGGEVLAALDIGKPAARRFSPLFAAARSGETGEAYAFDERALLLSDSRFGPQLADAGTLPPGASALLTVALRDPRPTVPGAGRATRLVEHALAQRGAGASGVQLRAYPSYTGEAVVGAWQWLAPHGFGVALEVSEREAFAPLARVELAVGALSVLLGTAVFAFIVALLRAERFRSELAEAQQAAWQLGNYELFEEIGSGGVARVFRARHRLLKRPTAVKVIHLHRATDELLARFDREVRLASQLMHPNTIEIFDFGRTPEGLPYYAMELLDGLTVEQIVARAGALPPARAVHVLRGLAGSLSEAHARGLVHRDVTPANVMLCRKGGEYDVPKLLDFGLIKDTREVYTRDLTRALKVLGTPAFMAPERIERPDSADFRSDLYAIGAVAYTMLAGRPPFVGDNDLTLAYRVVNVVPEPPDCAAPQPLPPDLVALVMACLAKNPGQRPQSAAAIAAALDALVLELPWPQSSARAWWEAAYADGVQPLV